MIRLVANVALLCETIIHEPPLNPKDIKRENIQCKLTYVAFGMRNYVCYADMIDKKRSNRDCSLTRSSLV